MGERVMVWDIETVPDVEGHARANGLVGRPLDEIRESMGDGFPKPALHAIVSVGALVAERWPDGYRVLNVGASHVGEKSERELIEAFVREVGRSSPRLVTFNGSSFDLPVLRYRAMLHQISAPELLARSYFHRFTEDAVDLCDVLASFGSSSRISLNEIGGVIGLPQKPDGINGTEVESLFRDGRIGEIADYCANDVIITYRLWLRYQLFRGRIDRNQFETSELDAISWSRIG